LSREEAAQIFVNNNPSNIFDKLLKLKNQIGAKDFQLALEARKIHLDFEFVIKN